MLNIHQISNAAAAVSMSEMSVEEFERWFRKGSRDCHAWGDADLVSAVLSVESVLSEYRFGDLEEGKIGAELENALRPFAPHWEKPSPSVFVLSNKSVPQSPETQAVAFGETEVIRKPPTHEITSAAPVSYPLRQAAVPA